MNAEESFLGLPIRGEVYLDDVDNTIQKSAKDFREQILDPFMEDDRLLGLYWSQYTPYFNDGSRCVFSVRSTAVKIPALVDNEAKDRDNCSSYNLELPSPEWVLIENAGRSIPPPDASSTYFRGREATERELAVAGVFGHEEWWKRNLGWSIPSNLNEVEDVFVGTPEQREFVNFVQQLDGLLTDGAFNQTLVQTFGDGAGVSIEKTEDGSAIINVTRVDHD